MGSDSSFTSPLALRAVSGPPRGPFPHHSRCLPEIFCFAPVPGLPEQLSTCPQSPPHLLTSRFCDCGLAFCPNGRRNNTSLSNNSLNRQLEERGFSRGRLDTGRMCPERAVGKLWDIWGLGEGLRRRAPRSHLTVTPAPLLTHCVGSESHSTFTDCFLVWKCNDK